MTTFFSIDVETTGLNPFDRSHRLASVGAIAVDDNGMILDTWYEVLKFTSWDQSTLRWWEQQNPIARQHMGLGDPGDVELVRSNPKEAARLFVEWAQQWDEHCVFVANPATFDHAWVLRWLTEAGLAMPFDYRTLCLRSAAWGAERESVRRGDDRTADDIAWGRERDGARPLVPHHALHDAQAQAFDLLEIMRKA